MSEREAKALARLNALMAEVVHEMRNPLSAISAGVELLRDSEGGRSRDVIKRSAVRLDRVLKALEDVLAIERGDFYLRTREQPFIPLVQRALGEARAMAGRRRVLLGSEGGEEPRVVCDGDRVAQLLETLVVYCVQRTQAEGTVSVVWREDDGRLWVTVRGSGATWLDLASSASSQREGPSLELFVGQAIARGHGGELLQEPGVGATFGFSLPLGALLQAKEPEPALTVDGLDH